MDMKKTRGRDKRQEMKLAALATAAATMLAAAALAATPSDDGVTCERFPDADTVLLDETERVAYNPDGTYDLTDEYWVKILTEKGRRGESSISLRYSRRYGEAEIVFVEAIGAGGETRTIDVSATTSEATDNSSMSDNIYDPLDRKIVCTVPGLKVGDIVHVKTRRRMTKPRCEGKWGEIAVMEWSMPILRTTFEVVSPPSLPLRKIAIRHPLGNVATNVVARADGSAVYTFTATNSPQAFPEPDMPPLYTQVQNVRVSTAEDWHEISRWYWNLCEPHLSKTNAALCAKAEEIGHDLRAMFKFVSQEIRYMGLTMEDTSPGYSPHDVDVTFDNRYGVCRDKAALLVAMLRHVGFNAFPVLIHVGAKMDPEIPQPYFNHAVVAVEREGESAFAEATADKRGMGNGERYILMDPTDENAKDLFPAYLSDNSYLVCRPEGDDLRTSPVPSPEANSLEVESRGALSGDGSVFLESEVRFGGINDTAYRHGFVRKQPVDRVKFFERVVKAVAPGAELVRCEVEPRDMRDTESPLRVSLAARMPESVLRGETRDELNVPFLSKALGMANFLLEGSTSLAQRKYPLVLTSTARVTENVRLDLGDGLGAATSLPSEEPGSMPGYGYARTFAVSNGTLSARRTLTVGAVEFQPKEYGDLREEIKRVEAAERRRPVFARDPLRDADMRYLLDSSEASVFSDRAWTVTNTVVKEVLTYAGKKGSAELKIGFNPAVESVELLYATVSNRSGEVRHVTDKERNVMDCGWAAAAPRYPAGKLLVVNLPSVEIGSVISYATVRTVTNAPAAFYAAYHFDSQSPLERRVVRVNDWRREAVRPKRVPREANQPADALWRDMVFVSSNRFERFDLDVSSVDPEGVVWDASDRPGCAEGRLRAVRDWMAKHVKVAGPGLYELPLGAQLTPPETVLRERYATRLDYVRTMCALLRGAGLDADVVLSSSDADEAEEIKRRIKYEKPNVRAFSAALCRVTLREGGFLWFGGTEKTYFVGTENQYSPLGPSSYEGSDYFDPAAGEFGVVTVPDPSFTPYGRETAEYDIRPDGSVDLTAVYEFFGPGVGTFRKKYSEILPEERSRRYQEILGGIAQAATATSDLEADVSSYPARRKFSCYIPDFATVQDNAITIQLSPLASSVPSLTGNVRQTPFAIGAVSRATETVTVVFPEGYDKVEHLPTSFEFADPADPGKTWLESAVKTEMRDGRLAVTISREVHKRGESWHKPELYELLKDWRRIASSRANRTITVRRR